MKYGLPKTAIEKICAVFARFREIEKAVLYGSRAKGNFKLGSDIDLTLYGEALTSDLRSAIASALDDLLLPYTIDLSVFDDLDHVKLRKHIERVGVVFYERESAGEHQGAAMKSGWQTSTLGDVLAVLRNGVTCRQDKSGKGDRISRIESISAASFDLEKVGYARLTERDKQRYRLQPGDILFSHINSVVHVGKTAVFNNTEPVYHGMNLLLMRPKEVVTSAYLEHALKFLFQSGYWRGVCKQSVNQASVNQQDISRVEIRYPKSLAEQQRIVGLLDEAFAGIATAKANAEKNLQNARALFESHLQSVFTQRGTGWVETTLGDVFTTATGTTPPKNNADFYGDFMPLVKPPELCDTPFDSAPDGLSEAGAAVARTLPEKSILVSCIGNLGKIGLNTVPVAFNQQINAILPDERQAIPEFMFFQSLAPVFKEQLESLASGTTVPIVNKSKFNSVRVVLPSLLIQKPVVAQLTDLRAETQRLASLYERKLAALEALKKSLLHQAFTGAL